MPELLEVKGLKASYGATQVLYDLDFKLAQGEITAILGANGAGKTTTLRAICQAVKTGGSVLFDGEQLVGKSTESVVRMGVAQVPDGRGTFTALSVEENLKLGAYVRKDRSGIAEDIERAYERFPRLKERRHQQAGTLSGGWKQRMALAACIMHEPQLLLLDEPTAGVDPKARREFWDQIHALAEEGLTVLVSTHYMDEAERCDRLAYISSGNLLVDGTVEEVIDKSNLSTWSVSGPDLSALTQILRHLPGIEQAVAFGNTLHVSGADAALLEQTIAPFRSPGYEWKKERSGLEDVFIHLMHSSQKKPGV